VWRATKKAAGWVYTKPTTAGRSCEIPKTAERERNHELCPRLIYGKAGYGVEYVPRRIL